MGLAVSLAADRPPPAGGPVGPGGAQEFFVEELALILRCHPVGAADLLDHGSTLLGRLPATFAALADGRLDWPRARALASELTEARAGGLDAAASASIEAALLPGADQSSIRALREAAAREVLARDAAAADESCGCPVLDLPPAVDRYRPTLAQYRFLRTRDATCRHPGCDRPAGFADADHVLPHAAGGDTDCASRCCLCRRHHRLTTSHPDWSYELTPDGMLAVTTPTGITRVTRPPGIRPPDPADPVIRTAPRAPTDTEPSDDDPPPV